MKRLPSIKSVAVSVAFFCLGTGGIRAEGDAADSQSGVTVEARGPVHEAFAQPYQANPTPAPVVPKQPPDPIPEQPPEQKPEAPDALWIPGYWAWDADRSDFLWVSGAWRVPPSGRKWVPGYWAEVAAGRQWVPGFLAGGGVQQVNYLEDPPPDSLDYGPTTPAPDDDSFYVPGSWLHRTTRYVWCPGYWSSYRRDALWCPARYYATPRGYLY